MELASVTGVTQYLHLKDLYYAKEPQSDLINKMQSPDESFRPFILKHVCVCLSGQTAHLIPSSVIPGVSLAVVNKTQDVGCNMPIQLHPFFKCAKL